MTRSKHLKKTIRERARKTGERYTAARRQVLLARDRKAGRTAAAPAKPRTAATPSRRGPGLSEKVVVEKTGHGYDHWFAVLDAFGAQKGHTAFADHLYSAHGIPGWHAQGIAVAYERARGLRAVNQSSTGKFQVSVSRAVPAAVTRVAQVLSAAAQRKRWLEDADRGLVRALEGAFDGPKPRTVNVRSADLAGLRYKWEKSTVEIRITSKKGGGATIAVGNTDLPDAAAVESHREKWKAALDSLKVYLQASR